MKTCKLVMAQPVKDNCGQEQVFIYTVTGKTAGQYNYRADLANRNGTTSSPILTIEVPAN